MSMPAQSTKHKTRSIKPYQIGVLIIAAVLFAFFFIPYVNLQETGVATAMPKPVISVPLENGRVYKQNIETHAGKLLRAIEIRFETFERTNRGNLDVKLYEDDVEIASWSVSTAELVDDYLRRFELDTPYQMKKDSVYAFTMRDTYRGRNKIGVWMERANEQGFYIDDEFVESGAFSYVQIYGNTHAMSIRLICIGSVFTVVALLLLFFICEHWDNICCFVHSVGRNCTAFIERHSREVTVWDWIILALLAGFCFFTMEQGDIIHTGTCSFTLLKGHILDFYEYNSIYLGGNNYMVSTYLLFALWNIPLAIMGLATQPTTNLTYGMLMWFKAFPTTMFVLSAILFYRICKKYEGKTGIKAKWATFLFLLTPTAFYSQFIFGQYDVLTTFFMVLGLKMLLDEKKHNMMWFSLLFGFATTFKYHALLFFVPILLYREKRLSALIKNAIFYFVPIILVNLPYLHSSAFSYGVQGFGAVNYFFAAGVDYYVGTIWRIYLVPMLWIAVCVYAYTKKTSKDPMEALEEIAYLTGLVVWLAFGVVFWHPQWLMIATPYLVLGLMVSKRRSIICLMDTALSVAYISFIESIWRGMTETFFGLGCFGSQVAFRQPLSPFKLEMFCLLKDSNIAFTVISGLLFARALLLRPKWKTGNRLCSHELDMVWFRFRSYVGVCIIVVPLALCLVSQLNTPRFMSWLNIDEANAKVVVNVQTDKDGNDLYAAVWSNEEGQDDLLWYPLDSVGDELYQCTIDLEKHKTLGTYFVHFYELSGRNHRMLTGTQFDIESLPDSIQPQIG